MSCSGKYPEAAEGLQLRGSQRAEGELCLLFVAAVGGPLLLGHFHVFVYSLQELELGLTYTHIHFCGAKSWSLLLVPVYGWPTISLEDKPHLLGSPARPSSPLCLCRPAFHWGVTCFYTPPFLSKGGEFLCLCLSVSTC